MVNSERDEKGIYLSRVLNALKECGAEGIIYSDACELSGFKAIVVLGGDGTLIRNAVKFKGSHLPILGINTGNVGFLTGAEKEDIETAIERLISGRYSVEKRMMLDVFVNGKFIRSVLNDAVVTRNGYSRMIALKICVNSTDLFTATGDGVIVSTPTGSTGYNMSAGGSICVPGSKAILITPICSHSMTNGAIIAAEDDEITIEVLENEHFKPVETGLTLDGNDFIPLSAKDTVTVKRSSSVTDLLKTNNRSFYETLKSKLS